MNPLFHQVIQDLVRKKLQQEGYNRPIPPRVLADAMRVFRVEAYHRIKDYFLILLGILSVNDLAA